METSTIITLVIIAGIVLYIISIVYAIVTKMLLRKSKFNSNGDTILSLTLSKPPKVI